MKNAKLHSMLRDIFLSMSVDELNKIDTVKLFESIKTDLDEIIVLKSQKAVVKEICEKESDYKSIEENLNKLSLAEAKRKFSSMGLNELTRIVASRLLIEKRVELEKSLSSKKKILAKMHSSSSSKVQTQRKLDGTRDYRYKENIGYKGQW